MPRVTYVQHPVTHELILKSEYVPPGEHFHTVLGSPEAFISPVTGEEISDRGRLRRHNQENGITDVRDYGPGYFQRKASEMDLERRGQTPVDKQERIEIIKQAIDQQRT